MNYETSFPSHNNNSKEPLWNKSSIAARRIKESFYYEEPNNVGDLPKFKNRHLITRDNPILGGIYVGAGSREAIVVDEKYEN